ncbi:MAG TPA: hypothetical protein VGI47_07975 [Candidatus Binataceae bacterium]
MSATLRVLGAAMATLFLIVAGSGGAAEITHIAVPGGKNGVGFDDLVFDPVLHRVVVPAAQRGQLVLIDPGNLSFATINGFSVVQDYSRGHADGVTSADAAGDKLLATDRTSRRLCFVDPKSKTILRTLPLGGGPDYVRFVESTAAAWVTEPERERIEIFPLITDSTAQSARSIPLAIPGGPESLVIDDSHDRAYTNLWSHQTIAIALDSRQIVARFGNGCAGSRGLALDPVRGFLFVGCAEGRLAVLDSTTGKLLGEVSGGPGVDIIAYSPTQRQVYLPSARGGSLAIVDIAASGAPTVVRSVPIPKGAHCVAADDSGSAYLCDPATGQIVVIRNPSTP